MAGAEDADDGLSSALDLVRRLTPTADTPAAVDRIALLEQLRSACAAAQAEQTAVFVAAREAEQQAQGVRARDIGSGVAREVGLARSISLHAAQRYCGWARVLTGELPATFAALRDGRTTEWRAQLLARETMWLSREHRAEVDAALGPSLARLGDRAVEVESRKLAYRLDPHSAVARARHAETERRVSVRPAPDTMAWLTALLPAAQAVACYASLARAADTSVATGDPSSADAAGERAPRGRGQVMADTLVERLTGQATAADVPVEIQLVVTDAALFGSGAGAVTASSDVDEPAHLVGYGPVPAGTARDLVRRPGDAASITVRRVWPDPDSGQLVTLDRHRRAFTGLQRRLLVLRDQTCRTPWCGAPIRHADHVRSYAAGGTTSTDNGEGLCAACNYAKQAPGWRSRPERPDRGAAGELIIRTPTGHEYRSRPPHPPGAPPPIRAVA